MREQDFPIRDDTHEQYLGEIATAHAENSLCSGGSAQLELAVRAADTAEDSGASYCGSFTVGTARYRAAARSVRGSVQNSVAPGGRSSVSELIV